MRDAAAHRGTNDSDVRMTLPLCSAQPALASETLPKCNGFRGNHVVVPPSLCRDFHVGPALRAPIARTGVGTCTS